MKAFEALVRFITADREREKADHEEFLFFFQELVKILPDELGREFGKIDAPTFHKGVKRDYGLELTVTDLGWWRAVIDEGGRFVHGPTAVQRDIWSRLNNKVRKNSLTSEQQLELMNLLNSEYHQ